jgi:exodeoxyribonuclease VII large subunit
MSGSFFDFHARAARGRRGQPDVPAGPVPSTTGSTAADQPQALTVSELATKIAGTLRAGFPSPVWVKGEVTGYKGPASSGHHYFRLKDDRSTIDAVVWAGEASRIRFRWADGMEVLACGSVATFAGRSTYQLKIIQMLPVGQGALELAFRQLKERLEREGLFAEERKRPIPAYPRRIALVTSREAAGLADILKVFRPFPWLKLMLFHVPVQGAAAHPAIANALAAINTHVDRLGGVDVILLGRGGGSLEDLWAFNEEIVARAVAASEVPVVTGVGHEVDVSIADLVADYHAHTPTEAARVITQYWRLAAQFLVEADGRLALRMRQSLRRATDELTAVRRHEAFRRPMDVIVRARQQRLDDLEKSTQIAIRRRLDVLRRRVNDLDNRLQSHRPAEVLAGLRERLNRLATRFAERHPRHRINRNVDRLLQIRSRLQISARHAIVSRRTTLDALTRQLDAVGPLQVLQRGYSITIRKADRQIIRSVSEIRPGDRMITRFADGEHEWVAGNGQMSLFS